MTDTVEAIGYRTDVKTRAKDAISDRKDAVMSKTGRVVDRIVGAAPSTPDMSMPGFVPDGEQVREGARQVKQGARQAVSVAQSNPIGLGIGAVAAGFLLGMMLPSTTVEDERLGELSDQVKSEARDMGQEALQRGKEVVQDAAQSASETVQEKGQEHGDELADSLRQSVEDVRPGA